MSYDKKPQDQNRQKDEQKGRFPGQQQNPGQPSKDRSDQKMPGQGQKDQKDKDKYK
jgi:hypothetical protein